MFEIFISYHVCNLSMLNLLRTLQEFCRNAADDSPRCFLEGPAHRMSVARRCLDVAVPEQLPDQRVGFRHALERKGVAKIMSPQNRSVACPYRRPNCFRSSGRRPSPSTA